MADMTNKIGKNPQTAKQITKPKDSRPKSKSNVVYPSTFSNSSTQANKG